MNALSVRALAAAGAAALAMVVALSAATAPVIVSALGAALALGLVAFAAQSRPLRDDQRLVYRPVYVRRQDVQHRVMSDFE